MGVLVFLSFLIILPLPNEARLLAPSQSDFYIDSQGKVVVVGEIGDPWPDRHAVRHSNLKAHIIDASYNMLLSQQDPFYTKFSVPYYAKLPVRIETNQIVGVLERSRMEQAYISSEFIGGIDKPADLIILSKNLGQLTKSDNAFTSWRIEIELLNNSTKPSTDTYVMASLRDSEDKVIGAAVVRSGLTIEPKESTHIVLEEALPTNHEVKSVYVYAESNESTTYYEGIFPLRQRISIRDGSGDYLSGSPNVGDKVLIRNDLFNYIQSDMKFWQIIQILKIVDLDQTINLDQPRSNMITAEIIATQARIEGGKPSLTNVTWVPDEEGSYVIESFLWSDLDNPVPLDRSYIGFGPYIDTTVLVRSFGE